MQNPLSYRIAHNKVILFNCRRTKVLNNFHSNEIQKRIYDVCFPMCCIYDLQMPENIISRFALQEHTHTHTI